MHDVTDGSALRSWLNSPLSSGLKADIYTSANILQSFAQVGRLQPEKGIPAAVLRGAVGFAILSVAKVLPCLASSSLCSASGTKVRWAAGFAFATLFVAKLLPC